MYAPVELHVDDSFDLNIPPLLDIQATADGHQVSTLPHVAFGDAGDQYEMSVIKKSTYCHHSPMLL